MAGASPGHDVVVVDEVSMADLDLFYRLISAINFKHTKLVIIGDPDQLPSVGAGNVYHDLIESKVIPEIILSRVFRYGVGGISTVCTDIRLGKPYVSKDLKKPTMIGDDKGFMFIPSSKDNTVKTAISLYKNLLKKGYKPEDILVLSSQNIGSQGTIVLNRELQKIANSSNMNGSYIESSEKDKLKRTKYYKNDLVIQTANNYKAKRFSSFYMSKEELDMSENIFIPNGDIGILKDINDFKNKCSVKFDDTILYDKNMLNMCMLGYSISIHKSQGGQAKVVILVTPRSHTHMLTSNILYVGASRAQELLFQIGEPSMLPNILKKKENLKRNTNLQNLLKKSNQDKTIELYDKIVEDMIERHNKEQEGLSLKVNEEEIW